MDNLAFQVAAPSYVLPGGIAQNADFLQDKVSECGLCLFEAKSCLAYTESDMPGALASLPLSWHIHLPLDLPWDNVPLTTSICSRLCAKAGFLQPRFAVLHPPSIPDQRRTLIQFAEQWHKMGGMPLFLENVAECDLLELGANFCADNAFGICLDVAHALTYGQKKLLDSELIAGAGLIHWSAPGTGDKHLPLTHLTAYQRDLLAEIAPTLSPEAMHLLEIFHWQGIEESLPILAKLLSA